MKRSPIVEQLAQRVLYEAMTTTGGPSGKIDIDWGEHEGPRILDPNLRPGPKPGGPFHPNYVEPHGPPLPPGDRYIPKPIEPEEVDPSDPGGFGPRVPWKPALPENVPPDQIPDDYEWPPGTDEWEDERGGKWVYMPGGTVISPDGSINYPDGSWVLPDGRRVPPGRFNPMPPSFLPKKPASLLPAIRSIGRRLVPNPYSR